MNGRGSILIAGLMAVSALPVLAGSGRYRITAEQVAATISSGGLHIAPNQVSMMAEILSSVSDPTLTVKSIDRAGDQRAVARLECADSQQCLPFMVALQISPSNNAEFLAVTTRAPQLSPSRPRPAAILVHAGSHAVLLLEGAHVHVRLSVICMENGSQGQTVRVSTPDRHTFFTAHVAQEGTLEGRL